MLNLDLFLQSLINHPLHPRFIHFPIAFSYLGVLLVLVACWRKDAFFDKTAFLTMFLVALSTIPAALTGIMENQSLYAGHAPNNQLKFAMSVLLLLVSVGATIWRWRKPQILNRPVTALLYVLAFLICAGLTTLLGAFGGIIVWGA